MSTLNISVTDQQAAWVDAWTQTYGYANRSELFRFILRFISQQPKILRDVPPLELLEFQKKPLKEVREKMLATGKYSKKFINGIVSGLKREGLYVD
jgi:Arc/MetJ-type ribon-helix-helix transcriptional regulator